MRKLFVLGIFFFFYNCSEGQIIEKLNEEEKRLLETFKSLSDSASLKMTTATEPGEKLMLCITFINKATAGVLTNQKVLLYQTNKNGAYEPSDPEDQTTAKIKATGFTDEKGRLFVETILPGSYGSSGDNRHIHIQVFDAKPEAYDIFFKDYLSTSLMTRFASGNNDQFFVAKLKYTEADALICFVDIKVKNQKN
ncbi:MAG: hypothetical protein GKR88_11915 [Flavobacteriaceae bacterium]|nr:MAG: hypothetical protein GKR88_11915 [Flavobacteriaceae bacterium]